MPMTTITEADVEQAALDWLANLGWQVAHGLDDVSDTLDSKLADYGQTVLENRFGDAQSQRGCAAVEAGFWKNYDSP